MRAAAGPATMTSETPLLHCDLTSPPDGRRRPAPASSTFGIMHRHGISPTRGGRKLGFGYLCEPFRRAALPPCRAALWLHPSRSFMLKWYSCLGFAVVASA